MQAYEGFLGILGDFQGFYGVLMCSMVFLGMLRKFWGFLESLRVYKGFLGILRDFNPNYPSGGVIIILCWKSAIFPEPNIRWTSDQSVNSSLSVAVQ